MGMIRNARRYLSQAETGAALLFVALAFAIVAHWVQHLFFSGVQPSDALRSMFAAGSPDRLFHFWTLASLAVSGWLAFLLMRRRLTRNALRRVLLVAVVHAIGAIRFYDWGLMLLSVLPLFALLAAFLLPARERQG